MLPHPLQHSVFSATGPRVEASVCSGHAPDALDRDCWHHAHQRLRLVPSKFIVSSVNHNKLCNINTDTYTITNRVIVIVIVVEMISILDLLY